MSTFTDDFSSGSLAGYTAVTDISTTPTGGPSGGTGIIATGTASQQYYGEITKVFAAATRVGRAGFTFDCAAASFSTTGNFNIDVRTAADQSILYCTQSATDPYTLDIYNTAPAGGSATPALSFPGALVGGAFTRVELRFWLSTDIMGALQLDGVWQCYVNGAYAGGQAGVMVGVAGTGWGKVGFSPMGAGSDVLISDDLPNLLTNLALVGVPGGGYTQLAMWQADGTVDGVITLPLDGTFDLGAVAVSLADNRVYVVQDSRDDAGCVLRVYNEFGTLVAATPIDDGSGPYFSYCLYVPTAGVLWVAVEGNTTGLVWAYDSDGTFQSTIATLTNGIGYIQAAYGMASIGGFLYYSSLTAGGSHDGVYKYDLTGGGASTLVLAGHVNGLVATPSNELLITARLSGDGVERIDTSGTVLQSYTVNSVLGIASDGAGAAWAGDDGNQLIVHLDLTTGSTTSFTSRVGPDGCDSALATSLPVVSANRVVALCTTRDGTLWQAYDNASTGFSSLRNVRMTTGEVLATLDLTYLIGEAENSYHCLFELPSLNLLTVDRASHAVIEVSIVDGTVAHTYGLTISPLDGAVNSTGTRLIYLDGLDVKAWNLLTDALAGTLFTLDVASYWPIWLPDCTLILSEAGYLADGNAVRYTMTGELLQTYAYDPALSPLTEGQYGIAADLDANRLYIVGDWDKGASSEQPGVLMFVLSTGQSLAPVVPLVGNLDDVDVVSQVVSRFATVMCDPFPPQPPSPVTFVIRRLRRFMVPWDDANRLKFVRRLELVGATGLGTVDTPDPVIMVRFSPDGGYTWGNERQVSVGKMGEYMTRVYAYNFGQARFPTFELTSTDAVAYAWVEALVDLESGTS